MTLFAVTSLAARLESVPSAAWVRILIAVVALVLLVGIIRAVAKMNKLILGISLFLIATFVGFNWIYERSEPKWATPVVARLAEFLPSKGVTK